MGDADTEYYVPHAYYHALAAARGLLCEQIRDPDGERNVEYTRGIVELIADTWGYMIGEPDMDAAKVRILGELGLPARAIA